MLRWTDVREVMGVPPEYQAAESPFVLKKNGVYYLWVSGFDYGRISLYISRDPFRFGDPVANRIAEQSGHAPEIITVNGTDYMACAAVASKFGNPPGAHDLHGVFIQPLEWTKAGEDIMPKVIKPAEGR